MGVLPRFDDHAGLVLHGHGPDPQMGAGYLQYLLCYRVLTRNLDTQAVAWGAFGPPFCPRGDEYDP